MREILSLNPHTYSSDHTSDRLAINLADIALEAGNENIENRINPFTLQITTNGKVINSELGEDDVSVYYTTENELRKRESEAGLKIRDCLINQPVGTVAVWLSPPNPLYNYKEGRITIGVNKTNLKSVKIMDSYGIPTTDLSPSEYLHIGWRLSELSEEKITLDKPEDLRQNPILFTLPPDLSPWEMLKIYIPLGEVWDKIESGEVHIQRSRALRAAKEIAPKVFEQIQNSQNAHDLINAVRFGEAQLANRGFSIDTLKLACEFEISESTSSPYLQTYAALTSSGSIRMMTIDAGDGKGPLEFTANCGHKNKRPFGGLLSECQKCGQPIKC